MHPRKGLALLELLVAVAIIAILLALLIPAVQKVRATASRMQGSHHLRQVGLAVQGYANSHNDRVPASGGYHSTFFLILPYLDHGNYYLDVVAQRRPYDNNYEMRLYLSPADPTLTDPNLRRGMASYAYNALVFVPEMTRQPEATFAAWITDGMSNTVLLTEHYAFGCRGAQFSWMHSTRPFSAPLRGEVLTLRRSSFADLGDIVPNSVSPPTITFQVRPRIEDCDPRVPQTPYEAGLLVGLADGSVRTVSPSISPSTFWATVTPAGGEVLGPDW